MELKAGEYRYEWFNADKAVLGGEGRLELPPGKHEFKPPFVGNSVLYLHTQ